MTRHPPKLSTVTKEKRPTLKMITFRIDAPTMEALSRLEAACEAEGVTANRRRSIAIRKALLEADAALAARQKA